MIFFNLTTAKDVTYSYENTVNISLYPYGISRSVVILNAELVPFLGVFDSLVRAAVPYFAERGKIGVGYAVSVLAQIDYVSRFFAVLKEYLEAGDLSGLKGKLEIGFKYGCVVVLGFLCKRKAQSVLSAGTGAEFESLGVRAVSEYLSYGKS